MDETLMQETTQPEVDNAEETTEVNTDEQSENSAEEATPEAKNGNSDVEAGENAPEGQEGFDKESAETSAVPKVRVKYNKQQREYTPEEAVPLVEMGLKWDSFKETHEKLKFIAANSGKSVGDLVDMLMESSDNLLYDRLKEQCGENEELAKQLFGYQKSERQRKFDEFKAAEQKKAEDENASEQNNLNERLANDFIELKKEYPDKFEKFDNVPESVLKTSIDKNISLLDAYLRHERAESKKAESVKAKQTSVAKQSTGSMSGNQAKPEPDLEDFSKAFNNALW